MVSGDAGDHPARRPAVPDASGARGKLRSPGRGAAFQRYLFPTRAATCTQPRESTVSRTSYPGSTQVGIAGGNGRPSMRPRSTNSSSPRTRASRRTLAPGARSDRRVESCTPPGGSRGLTTQWLRPCPRSRGAGKPVPFRAPSNARGCPRMPARSRANFLPFFAIRCATNASCWQRLWSLDQ